MPTVKAIIFAVIALLALCPASPARADSTFTAPAYSSANCTPQASGINLGIGPQQWNSAVGLPLTPSGNPAAQRIVVGEFDSTANQTSVTAMLLQCGLPDVQFTTETNDWYPPATAPGAEATLDASVIASALPANAQMVLVNVSSNVGWYGLLVESAQACGLVTSQDPSNPPFQPNFTHGPSFPAGGCTISLSYGGAETIEALLPDMSLADWMMNELAENGVIVAVSAGDEGSGGCMSMTGMNYGDGVQKTVASVSVASNIMTVNSTAHGFSAGQQVFLGSISPSLDRMYSIISASTNSFTVGVNFADAPTTATPGGVAAVNFGGLVPQFLATHPDALGVGGTQWVSQVSSMANGLNIAYVPGATVQNFTWKDSHANSNCANLADFPISGGEATGGGQSAVYAMPAYQQAAAMSSYPTATSRRMMPDLAALAGWPTYGIANYGESIAAAGIQSNQGVLIFDSATSMVPGEAVVVSGMTAPFTGMNGTHTITAVSGLEVRFSLVAANVAAQYVSAGIATQACVSYPCNPATFPWYPVVGTSAATPLVAIGIANVNAVLSARGMSPINNAGGSMDIHSIVYNPTYRSAFTDVVYGNNDLQGLGDWDALTGYDMVTGMGVPNFNTLADLLIAAQTPAPAPSGGGSSQVTTTATPVATVEAPVQVGSGPGQAVPTPTTTTLAPGVLVATGPKATNAPRLRADGSASRRLDRAPVIDMPMGKWSVPVVKVPGPPSPLMTQMRIGGSWTDLGLFTPTDNGVLSLPSMRLTRAGAYPVRLKTSNGRPYFVQIDVARPSALR